jgi:carboxylate-amine ligase
VFASSRTVVFGAFPRTGLPGTVGSYADYVATLDALMLSDAVPDPNSVWWDVRLQPALGTVEVRVMDAQSTIREAAPLIALVQSLARLELEGDGAAATPGPEVLAENRFLAARDGMAARLLDPTAPGRLIPAREMLDALLVECRPHALALGCLDSLERVPRLAAANGADRQRAWVRVGASLEQVVELLAERFLAPAWPNRTHATPREQI